ncbi:MAG: amidotransferase [Gemmatimonadetes bacterium]|nr:amidotransferase [Gemmatimonadota bacterium]
MRAHCLRHVPFEGLGSIGPWLATAGYRITSTRFYASDRLPDPREIDFLVAVGGPMSVNDEETLPWLVEEKRFIRDCMEAGTPVLGVCLGAQLIASAMGAPVYPNSEREIGWFPIRASEPRASERRAPERPASERAGDSHFRFPSSVEVFHWHGETFDLPPGAVHLARSVGCENQAFQLGGSVIGLQFHLETTAATAWELVSHSRDELSPSRFVQSEGEILAASPDRYETINALMGDVLTFLHRAP